MVCRCAFSAAVGKFVRALDAGCGNSVLSLASWPDGPQQCIVEHTLEPNDHALESNPGVQRTATCNTNKQPQCSSDTVLRPAVRPFPAPSSRFVLRLHMIFPVKILFRQNKYTHIQSSNLLGVASVVAYLVAVPVDWSERWRGTCLSSYLFVSSFSFLSFLLSLSFVLASL